MPGSKPSSPLSIGKKGKKGKKKTACDIHDEMSDGEKKKHKCRAKLDEANIVADKFDKKFIKLVNGDYTHKNVPDQETFKKFGKEFEDVIKEIEDGKYRPSKFVDAMNYKSFIEETTEATKDFKESVKDAKSKDGRLDEDQ